MLVSCSKSKQIRIKQIAALEAPIFWYKPKSQKCV